MNRRRVSWRGLTKVLFNLFDFPPEMSESGRKGLKKDFKYADSGNIF